MINRKNLTDKVWVDNVLWTVVSVISPNKYDDFLLLQTELKDTIHEDDETVPISMAIVDLHNEAVYPNTDLINTVMESRNKEENDLYEIDQTIRDTLFNYWSSLILESE